MNIFTLFGLESRPRNSNLDPVTATILPCPAKFRETNLSYVALVYGTDLYVKVWPSSYWAPFIKSTTETEVELLVYPVAPSPPPPPQKKEEEEERIQPAFGYRLGGGGESFSKMNSHTELWNYNYFSTSQWRPRPIWSNNHEEIWIFVKHVMSPFLQSFVTLMFMASAEIKMVRACLSLIGTCQDNTSGHSTREQEERTPEKEMGW